jgi:hypothetical protein
VIALMVALFATIFLFLTIATLFFPISWTREKWRLLLMFVPVLVGEGYAIYRISKHDKQMCRELGFVCPHCHEPLYEPRGTIHINGQCPKCRNSVLP